MLHAVPAKRNETRDCAVNEALASNEAEFLGGNAAAASILRLPRSLKVISRLFLQQLLVTIPTGCCKSESVAVSNASVINVAAKKLKASQRLMA